MQCSLKLQCADLDILRQLPLQNFDFVWPAGFSNCDPDTFFELFSNFPQVPRPASWRRAPY